MNQSNLQFFIKVGFRRQYLVVSSQEVELAITVGSIENEGEITAHSIGQAVLKIMNESHRAHQRKKKPKEPERLLKISEAARVLGLSHQTVRNLIARKGLEIKRTPGGHRRISLNDLQQEGG